MTYIHPYPSSIQSSLNFFKSITENSTYLSS